MEVKTKPAFMKTPFNGLGMGLGNLSLLSNAKSRSISAENPTGAKSSGGMLIDPEHTPSQDLGQGWKVRPCIPHIAVGETVVLADIAGPGAIQHIWMTAAHPRWSILRIYWDGEETPSVEVPYSDFFANPWGDYAQLSSLAVCVNPGSGLNCFWEMPFRKHCKITLENVGIVPTRLYFQIDYTLTEVPDHAAYFHAQFRRSNPLPYKEVHAILDGIEGMGHYVGTSLGWGVNNSGWWGEGEIKFFIDGDAEFPTICGTGTEDYFLGSYNFDPKLANNQTIGTPHDEVERYQPFTTPYSGLHQVVKPDGCYRSQMRFGMYRWHIMDPIRFEKDLRVTIQALGWRAGGKYLPLQDDISSVAYWYQTEPHGKFPTLPDREYLENI